MTRRISRKNRTKRNLNDFCQNSDNFSTQQEQKIEKLNGQTSKITQSALKILADGHPTVRLKCKTIFIFLDFTIEIFGFDKISKLKDKTPLVENLSIRQVRKHGFVGTDRFYQ